MPMCVCVFDSFLFLKTKLSCTVCCDAFIHCVIHHIICVIYCRSHSILSSLFLVKALIQYRSLVFTATQKKDGANK